MQYIFNERRETVTTIEFKNSIPISTVLRINYYMEQSLTGLIQNKEFRYSFDNITWVPWNTLTQTNLKSIVFSGQLNFYLHVRYTRARVVDGNIKGFYIFYDSPSSSIVCPVEASVNADFFGGQPPEYYLNMANHFGPFLGITMENKDVTNLGAYYGRTDSTLGTIFYFRSLQAGNAIVLTETNGIIRVDVPNNLFIKEASIGNDFQWINGILTVDRSYIDGSLMMRDASITWLYNNTQPAGVYVKESSLGSGFTWSGGMLNVDASIGPAVYDTLLDASLIMPYPVGGISAGTSVNDLKGDTITSLFDELLFPTVNPTLTSPSASLASNQSSLFEPSTQITSLTFTTTFSRGSINPQYNASSPYRSGIPNYFTYTGPRGAEISHSNNNSVDVGTIGFYDVILGIQTWYSSVSYDSGVQPYNNKGAIYDSSLAAGTIISTPSISIEGTYPYFASITSLIALTKLSLTTLNANPAPNSSGITLITEDGINKQKFEICNVRLSLHTLTGVRTYNTTSGQWEYELGTAPLSLTRWTVSSVSNSIQGYPTNYTRYTYNGPNRGSTIIRLEF